MFAMEKYCVSECVCLALVILHAKRMRLVILSSVTCLAAPDFFTLSHKRYNLWMGGWGGIIDHKICVVIFSTTFVWNISHSKKNSARFIVNVKYVLLFEIWTKLEFSGQIYKKNPSNINFHEHPSSGSRDVSCGQTDSRDVSVAFQQFSGAHANLDSRLPARCNWVFHIADLLQDVVYRRFGESISPIFCFTLEFVPQLTWPSTDVHPIAFQNSEGL